MTLICNIIMTDMILNKLVYQHGKVRDSRTRHELFSVQIKILRITDEYYIAVIIIPIGRMCFTLWLLEDQPSIQRGMEMRSMSVAQARLTGVLSVMLWNR